MIDDEASVKHKDGKEQINSDTLSTPTSLCDSSLNVAKQLNVPFVDATSRDYPRYRNGHGY